MRKTKTLVSLFLALILVFGLFACNNPNKNDVWENATYKDNMEFGDGSKTLTLEVKVEEHTVTFTVKTDKETVGDALLEHELIAGDDSQYGLYVKTVNGITADYDIDKSYWILFINGEYAPSGVDSTEITEGAVYQFVYTK